MGCGWSYKRRKCRKREVDKLMLRSRLSYQQSEAQKYFRKMKKELKHPSRFYKKPSGRPIVNFKGYVKYWEKRYGQRIGDQWDLEDARQSERRKEYELKFRDMKALQEKREVIKRQQRQFNFQWKLSQRRFRDIKRKHMKGEYISERDAWRVLKHGGSFSKLGPKGTYASVSIIEIEMKDDFDTVLELMYPNMPVIKSKITIMDAIENRVLKPIVKQGIQLVSRYVPMMTGKLRKAMVDALREYIRFDVANKHIAKIFVNTIGDGTLDYARPVNHMPETSLRHYGGYRKEKGKIYYLRDVAATTHWFDKVVEELSEFAKKKWQLFVQNYLIPKLRGHRPLTPEERESEEFSSDYVAFDESEYSISEVDIMGEERTTEFPALRRRDFEKAETLDNLVYMMFMGDSGRNKAQKKTAQKIYNGLFGEGYATVGFVNLFFKVQYKVGTYK
jgi:hypothetical protein